MGVEWDPDNPAPKVAVDAGVAIAKSASGRIGHKGLEGAMWVFGGAMAAAMVVL